jgi:CYTH domain-containing protein
LSKKDGEAQCARIRKTIFGLKDDLNVRYDFNQKQFVEAGVSKEKEVEISKEKYEEFLKDKNKDQIILSKTRFVFKYKDQVFELDLFKEPLNGLAILELELKKKDQQIFLPPFLKVIKNVTGNSRFNNFNLASTI